MALLDTPLRELLERFDATWQSGHEPDISAFIQLANANPALANKDVLQAFLVALIGVDLEYRWKLSRQAGNDEIEKRVIESYIAIIPQLGPLESLPLELIASEFRVRHSWGDFPPPTTYLNRFPSYATELHQRLTEATLEVAASGAALPRIEDYEILSLIGDGSYGVVYKARAIALDRVVAIKILKTRSQDHTDAIKRFQAEAQSIAKIKHGNVITLYVCDLQASPPYLVLEHADGGNLRDKLCQQQREAADAMHNEKWQYTVANWVTLIARGLAAAHAQGVVHRDLKPENILFDKGQPKIADFGFAHTLAQPMTSRVAAGGTRPYMSPEQLRGVKLPDCRTDIYSLGVILFELLTNSHPFPGETQILHTADLTRDAPSPNKINSIVTRDLATICLKCLEKDPQRRFDTAPELADDLARFCEHQPIKSRPLARHERLRRFVYRHRLRALLGLLSVILAALIISYYLFLRGPSFREYADYAETSELYRAAASDSSETSKQQAFSLKQRLERIGPRLSDAEPGSLDWHCYQMGHALQALAVNDPERALKELAPCKVDDISDVRIKYLAYYANALAQLLQAEYRDALLLFQKAEHTDPTGDHVWTAEFGQALCLRALMEWREARRACDMALTHYQERVINSRIVRTDFAEAKLRSILVECLAQLGDTEDLEIAYEHCNHKVFERYAEAGDAPESVVLYASILLNRAILGNILGKLDNEQYANILQEARSAFERGSKSFPKQEQQFAAGMAAVDSLLRELKEQ